MTAEAETGMVKGVVRALGTVVGVHLQYARHEAANDAGRVIGGALLIVVGALVAAFGLLVLHVALFLVLRERTLLTPLGATLTVAGVDAVLALGLFTAGRARLRKPVLEQTRALVRKTVTSLAEI